MNLGNLKVAIHTEPPNFVIATGLDIYYMSQGYSLKEAIDSFMSGFEATILENVKEFGSIKPYLKNSLPQPIEWHLFWCSLDENTVSSEVELSEEVAKLVHFDKVIFIYSLNESNRLFSDALKYTENNGNKEVTINNVVDLTKEPALVA